MLTVEQQCFLSASREPGRSLMLRAPAGTGKGYVLRAVVDTKRGPFVGHLSLAATAAAAMNGPVGYLSNVEIPGTSVHQKLPSYSSTARAFWASIKRRRWEHFSISIDEFSMLSADAFEELLFIVHQSLPTTSTFRTSFYFFGDVFQIGAVGVGMLSAKLFWSWLNRTAPRIFRLETFMRFGECEYYHRLTRELYRSDTSRNGPLLCAILQERVITPPPPCNSVRWITQENKQVHKINARFFYSYVSTHSLVTSLAALDPVALSTKLGVLGLDAIPSLPALYEFVDRDGSIVPNAQFAVGMVITSNRNDLDGDVYKTTKGEQFELISVSGTDAKSLKRKHSASHGRVFLLDHAASVVGKSLKYPDREAYTFKASIVSDDRGAKTYDLFVAPSAGGTIHKSQGATIVHPIVVDPASCKTFGELVTLCTRGTTVSNFYVRPFSFGHVQKLCTMPMNKHAKKFIALPCE